MTQINNLFKIGDTVLTKSNGKAKVIAINILTTKKGVCVQYMLEGFKKMLFYEEDLKSIQEEIII